MARVTPFEAHHQRYEKWFDKHEAAYLSELLAVRPFVPWEGRGLEIGVGTGRFAGPLGVPIGIDPSPAMLAHAAAKGISPVEGVAESLPFASCSFDYVLVVTTICFVDSAAKMLAEAHRILRPEGRLTVGFIDLESPLGQTYRAHQNESVFYREATFYSSDEVAALLEDNRFSIDAWGQTLSTPLPEIREIEPLAPGHGECAFVIISATSRT